MTEELSALDIAEGEGEGEEEGKPFTVQFRISGIQAKTMARLADMLYNNKVIRFNSINALAKACAFTQVNLYLQYEAKEMAFKHREAELERDRLDLEKKGITKYGTIPNLGTY